MLSLGAGDAGVFFSEILIKKNPSRSVIHHGAENVFRMELWPRSLDAHAGNVFLILACIIIPFSPSLSSSNLSPTYFHWVRY